MFDCRGSWKPLVTGQPVRWRESFLFEYFLEANYPTTPTVVAVRTATAKLIKYPGHDEWTELFDLGRDPYEIRNLVRDPAARDLLGRMNAEFDAQVKATGFHIPDYADKPGDVPVTKKAKAKKKQ